MKNLPVGAIFPEGGEPLYEEAGTGLRLTAADYAVKHGFDSAAEVREAFEKMMEGDKWEMDHKQ